MRVLEVGVDVVERDSGGEHQHLRVVQQLADLLGRPRMTLELGRHPGLGGLLDQLLADLVDTGLECLDRPGALRARLGLLAQLGPELLERLHGDQPRRCRGSARQGGRPVGRRRTRAAYWATSRYDGLLPAGIRRTSMPLSTGSAASAARGTGGTSA